MKIFISGGCKNGKSTFAQKLAKKLAADGRPLYYVATMDPHDDEDVARIARHLREREGWGFETVEQPTDLCAVLERTDPKGSYLFDSVTALVANEMFRADGSFDKNAGERVSKDILKFLNSVEHAVLVSDYIYSDAALYDEMVEDYRRALALCDRTAAKASDKVFEVTAAQIICHKGEPK